MSKLSKTTHTYACDGRGCKRKQDIGRDEVPAGWASVTIVDTMTGVPLSWHYCIDCKQQVRSAIDAVRATHDG